MAMTINIPAGCYEQTGEQEGLTVESERTHTFVLKGDYNALETLLKGLSPGAKIASNWVLNSGNLTRTPGDTGVLNLVCDHASDDDALSSNSTKALNEVWTLKSVRNDMSLLAYCGTDRRVNPQRSLVEAWLKEPDGKLAAETKFKTPDDTIVVIAAESPATVDLINKFRKGIDSVMRFYPLLTRTRTYSKAPARCYEHLAEIDTPTVGSMSDFEQIIEEQTVLTAANTELLQKPGNLDIIIASHSWLKCQDDVTKLANGKFQRIESWMGLPTENNADPWDPDLYGSVGTRWPMPYVGVPLTENDDV